MTAIAPSFQGEMQLAGWSKTHKGGSKVVFWLPDDDALSAFEVMTVRKGNQAGQRFACVLVEIGDDEKPVQLAADIDAWLEDKDKDKIVFAMEGLLPKPEKPPIGPLCKLAVQWCKEPEFWKWATKIESANYGEPINGECFAKEWLITVCQIRSRRELDAFEHKANLFHRRIRVPYMQYLKDKEAKKWMN